LQQNPASRWSYTAIRRIDASGAPLAGDERRQWIPYRGDIFGLLLQQQVGLALPSVMVERELLADAGGFDEGLAMHEDFELWLRLAQRNEVTVLTDALTEAQARDAPARRRLRRQRVHNAARLARYNARQGDAAATFATLAASFARGWAQPRWWQGATLATLRLALPRAITRRGWIRP
jgi:GT2 family glycosyltransferase